MKSEAPRAATGTLHRVTSVLKVVLPLLVFGYLFARIDSEQVIGAIARIPTLDMILAMLALFGAVVVGVLRWRALFHAYGASSIPPWRELTRGYFVATFYNLLPGAVAGDVVRGYETRHSFREGLVRSMGVVVIERVLGFAGLLVLAAAASFYSPSLRDEVLLYSGLGLLAATAALLAVTHGRHVSRYLPRKLAAVFDGLPTLMAALPFVYACVLSVLSHVCVTATGHLVLASLDPSVTWANSSVIFPIATLAGYFPLTVAGAGTRDATLVMLGARLGISEADALASSLALLFCHLVLGAIGFLVRNRRDVAAAHTIETGGVATLDSERPSS